jgi:predicted Kef-type K+ transport protein
VRRGAALLAIWCATQPGRGDRDRHAAGLSSTAQVLPFLRSTGEINTRTGERAFSVLLLQDLAIVPMLIVLTACRARRGRGAAGLAADRLLRRRDRRSGAGRALPAQSAAAAGGADFGTRTVRGGGAVHRAGASALMHALGLSPALGAFVAGVMLADSPYRHELEADIEPFRSILLGLFFIAVGHQPGPRRDREQPLLIVGLAIAW